MGKFLHEILDEIIEGMSFPVDFTSATDNLDGTFTLDGICDFHHAQPGFDVVINTKTYTIVDYDYSLRKLIVRGADPIAVTTFTLYRPIFVHGTPMQTQVEVQKSGPMNAKTPLIYLMEPYDTEDDNSTMSSIDWRSRATLCYLTQADIPKWLTDDFYHNSIHPMNNLRKDVMAAIEGSNLFYMSEQKTKPTFYTKFGINIQQLGTKTLYFSENLSGIGEEIRFEHYEAEDCPVC